LTFAGWGGEYQAAQEEAFFLPFSAMTGAAYQIKPADLDRLRAQVDEGAVAWDLMTLPADIALALGREGYLAPIDYAVVEKTAIVNEVVLQYGVGADFFSTVIAHPSAAAAPRGWTDFWTVEPLELDVPIDPGQARSLQRSPVGTLEFALLADGVPLDGLYPLDIERAFASLDRIRGHVLVWYEDSKQPIELILGGQVGMASAWNVRPWQLGVEGEIGLQWTGGMLSADLWIVPKGAPNAEIAMDLINFATRAAPAANFSRLVPYGPVNLNALALLTPERQAVLPTSPANLAVQFVQNWAWWADNLLDVTARFENWLLGTQETPPAE
jgi:putative spermidine/putrescine transport system substrate-binding protein